MDTSINGHENCHIHRHRGLVTLLPVAGNITRGKRRENRSYLILRGLSSRSIKCSLEIARPRHVRKPEIIIEHRVKQSRKIVLGDDHSGSAPLLDSLANVELHKPGKAAHLETCGGMALLALK